MATLVLTDMQKVALAVSFVDGAGNPAPVDGAPVWATSDTALLDVVAAADGLSAVATAVGPLGTAQVSVTADADLGSGVETLVGTLDVNIVPDKAVSVNIAAGTPEPK